MKAEEIVRRLAAMDPMTSHPIIYEEHGCFFCGEYRDTGTYPSRETPGRAGTGLVSHKQDCLWLLAQDPARDPSPGAEKQ